MRIFLLLLPALALAAGVGERPALADPQDLAGLPEESLVGNPIPGEMGYDPDYRQFYEQLAPYGQWVERSPYGRVWRPWPDQVGPEFQPYATNGRWVYTDAGWSFSSDFDWGWATFHYGRWFTLPGLGWVWLPGKTWAPSWCDWRVTDDAVGWAPLPPVGFEGDYSPPLLAWTFVPTTYFVQPNVYRYAIPRYRIRDVYYRARPVTAFRVYGGARYRIGPSPMIVSRAAGVHIRPLTVRPPRPGIVQPYRVRPGWAGPIQPRTVPFRGTPPTRGYTTQRPLRGHMPAAPQYGSPGYRNPPSHTYVPGLYRREGTPQRPPPRTGYQNQPLTSPQPRMAPQARPPLPPAPSPQARPAPPARTIPQARPPQQQPPRPPMQGQPRYRYPR